MKNVYQNSGSIFLLTIFIMTLITLFSLVIWRTIYYQSVLSQARVAYQQHMAYAQGVLGIGIEFCKENYTFLIDQQDQIKLTVDRPNKAPYDAWMIIAPAKKCVDIKVHIERHNEPLVCLQCSVRAVEAEKIPLQFEISNWKVMQ